ncbi:heavy metal translocating P-type ATPase [Lentzea flaviverrucosa]|uniref:Heavy metal-(Cd/Co/Hg/Pb/Zn)-translocating P-type ATPase n=1 Tax=Lentzea flaviverrucosa TaxID=200379 RepID=A0A1H9XWN6_9PSEU|nr:heavy metal translocating P-type ATPase [Lentzea flaviverrucosa]RDI34315.1 heavy metal-(Cd/Co/Hg/Pb/Zn)-translocating P-type ATPase [Lentzea flaviverrucosa]SES50514.1 heavy metal-(Cd/Co/Hg/Pb/Zn)-translocating P-type ATPase [Lentzea flaviverrucosa]
MKARTGRLFLTAVVLTTIAGGLVRLQDPPSARIWWAVATAAAVVPAVWWVVEDLRARRFGADVLAVLALVGTLVVGEYLAGAVVAVMVGTGHALDDYARRRARRDLSALLERAPRRTQLREADGLRPVDVDAVAPGDQVVVRPGEVVPVDGILLGDATFDESALTGEPDPVARLHGERVRSGVVAVGSAVDVRAAATAHESTYAGVVRLAEEAAAMSAPVVRVADRIAVVFLPVAVLVAGLAAVLSGDLTRAVAVLVTATPCPLLLAVPVAITAGMSRASRVGVVLRDGQALEALGSARIAVLDKTGTVTVGRPVVVDVVAAPRWTAAGVLGLAASVEQLSTHALASAVVEAARTAGLRVEPAQDVRERPGHGVTGRVGSSLVFVGARDEEPSSDWERAIAGKARLDAATPVWVQADDEFVGALLLRDPLRREAGRTVRRLRAAGLRRIVMLTGDRPAVAQDVAGMLGLDDVVARCTPEDKVARVREERSGGVTIMVGDGINDAPALAAADVGVALGNRGSAAAAQAADAVILDDRIDRLADGVEIAANAKRIAVQSAAAGMGLALVAMGFAAFGLLPAIGGALVQEAIDVAVILYSLRALLPLRHRKMRPGTTGLLTRFDAEHAALQDVRDAVRVAADGLRAGVTTDAAEAVRHAHRLVVERLLPHEHAEEHELYPALTEEFGDQHATVPMSRGHAEIERLVRRLGRHLDEPGGMTTDQVDDLRATLYGLDAVLRLHFAQEEEGYFVLAEPR